ncbi:MAG: peptidase [Oxalobacter sp.]|nr:peptidase [Oxalobacter sp.]
MDSGNRPASPVENLTGGFSLPQGEPSRLLKDIIDHLMIHPNSTFPVHVGSMAMRDLGIFKGDTLLVDRSLEPHHNQIVLAVVDGEFLVRRLHIHQGTAELHPANNRYPIITPREGHEIILWGVAVTVIKRLLRKNRDGKPA